jgi:hypothetical protein
MPLLRSGPPPEVCLEIDEAWERAQWALPDGVWLDFETAPDRRRAWGVLRLVDGSVLERLSASDAIAIACGDAAIVALPGGQSV